MPETHAIATHFEKKIEMTFNSRYLTKNVPLHHILVFRGSSSLLNGCWEKNLAWLKEAIFPTSPPHWAMRSSLTKGKQAPPTLEILNFGHKDCKKTIDIMWHGTIPKILQLFMWQLNNGGISMGTRSIYMGRGGKCNNCRFNIGESYKQCFMD